MINQAGFDALEPLQRAEFENRAVREWLITWPDGSTDAVRAHYTQLGSDGEALAFHWSFLGAHRYINLSHVRDIVEVPVADDQGVAR
jgi:hypothetical protein